MYDLPGTNATEITELFESVHTSSNTQGNIRGTFLANAGRYSPPTFLIMESIRYIPGSFCDAGAWRNEKKLTWVFSRETCCFPRAFGGMSPKPSPTKNREEGSCPPGSPLSTLLSLLVPSTFILPRPLCLVLPVSSCAPQPSISRVPFLLAPKAAHACCPSCSLQQYGYK